MLFTGIPRSGTTLACFITNQCENAIALHEPMKPSDYFGLTHIQAKSEVDRFLLSMRTSAFEKGIVVSKHTDGKVPDNDVHSISIFKSLFRKKNRNTRRQSQTDKGEIKISKNLTSDFLLAVKHPPFFTTILDELVKDFSCFAFIRNPLSVLLSWSSLPFPVSKGRSPSAEGFDPTLKVQLDNEPNLIQRQIILIDWFFGQYLKYLDQNRVIKYEEVIQSNGQIILDKLHLPDKLNLDLKSKNTNKVYPKKMLKGYYSELMNNPSLNMWNYYMQEDIEKVYELMRS